MTDITVTQCQFAAINGRFWSDFVLSLERVQMNGSNAGLYLDMLGVGTVSVAIKHSSIHVPRAIHLLSNTGQFNVSVYSSHVSSMWTAFRIVCRSNVTMRLRDSTIEHVTHGQAFYVSAAVMNIYLRRINVKGSASFTASRLQIPHANQGTIKIEDSIFRSGTNRVLDAGNRYFVEHAVHAHDVLLVNNTFQTQNENVYLSVPRYSLPWGLILKQNMFKRCSLNMRGNIGNTSIKENTFQFPMSAITIHVQRSDDGFTEIAGNVFNGGSVSLDSDKDGEVFAVLNNLFNRTTVFLKTPTVTLNNNSFLNGTGSDVKFEGSGYEGQEINCTHNFWGTTDVKEISRRIYDWSYDETLPKIQFIPLYRFSNLTDLQYPARTFFAADGRIGGNIGGTVTLTYAASPYTVTDNIMVGKLETLIVEAGVTLRFMNGVGILVEGKTVVKARYTVCNSFKV